MAARKKAEAVVPEVKEEAKPEPVQPVVAAPVVAVAPVPPEEGKCGKPRGYGKKPGLRNVFLHLVKGEYKYSQKYEFVAQSVLEAQLELEKIEPFDIPDHTHQAWYSGNLHQLRDYLVRFNAAREAMLKAHLDIIQGLADPGSCGRHAGGTQDEA